MRIRARAELHQSNARVERIDRESDVGALVPGFNVRVEGGEERHGDVLELRVGVGQRGFERIDVG